MTTLYPHQYIISNKVFKTSFKDSYSYQHKNLYIQIHTSNINNFCVNDEVLLYGEVFDYEAGNYSNQEIINSLLKLSFDEKIKKINKLSGFFLFILFENDKTVVINDAAGQLETYIYRKEELFVASQPTLIAKSLKKSTSELLDPSTPPYIVENKINIFNKTPFLSIDKLIPNFYYHIENAIYHRFYPTVALEKKDIQSVAKEGLWILEQTLKSISYRKPIAIAITAGWDSRVLFAASMDLKEVEYYVLNHNTEDAKVDITIANEIVTSFNKSLKVIDYNLRHDSLLNKDMNIWKDNFKTHSFASLMINYFPNKYIINGNISEVARNFYDPLPNNLSVEDICFILGLKAGDYEKLAIKQWLNNYNHNINILDAIYWEHKMPNWAGSSKTISYLYQDVISPFNNRYLLSLLLSTSRKDRDKYFHKIYLGIFKIKNLKLASIKINPTKKHNRIVLMKKLYIYPLYRYIFFKLRKLKF